MDMPKNFIELISFLKEKQNFTLQEEKEILELLKEKNLPLRLMAIWSLKKFRFVSVDDHLWELFLQENRETFFVVTEIIIEKGILLEELADLLFDLDYPESLRKNALYVLLRIYAENSSKRNYIVNLLNKKYFYAEFSAKTETVEWLKNFGFQVDDFIFGGVSSKNASDEKTKEELSTPQKKKKLSFFINKLTHFDIDFASRLSFFLSEEDWESIVEACRERLEEEYNTKIISILIKILGLLSLPQVKDIILPYLTSSDSRVRADAVETLCQLRDQSILHHIIPLVEDSDNRVRANVAGCLWSFGGLRALAVLKDMLNSGKELMRRSAVYMLGELGTIQAIDILEEVLFNDPEYSVKLQALKSLEKILDPQVVDILERYLKEASQDGKFDELKLEAVRILANMGGERVIAIFEELLQYKNIPLYIREEINFQLNILKKGGTQ